MRKQCVQSCIYTGVYTCESRRVSKRRALPHCSEPGKGGLRHHLGYSVLKSLHHIGSPGPLRGCCTRAWKEVAQHRPSPQRGTRTRARNPHQGRGAGYEKGAVKPHQQRQSHVSCPSGQALTTQAPTEPQDMVHWAGWCLGARLPSPGQKQKDPRKSRTPLLQLWRTISLHFRGKCGFGGVEGCRSSSSAPTSVKPAVPMSSWDPKTNSRTFLQDTSKEREGMNRSGLLICLCRLCCHTWSGTAFWLWLLLEPLAQGVPRSLRCEGTHAAHATPCHQAASTAP